MEEETEPRLVGLEELETVIRQHGPRFFARALRMCRNVADAEDIVQVTFIRLIENWKKKSFKDGEHVTSWAMTVLRNCAIDHLRGLKRHLTLFPPEAVLVDDKAHGASRSPDAVVELACVLSFVDTLPEEQAETWFWYELLGLTLPEIAELAAAPLGTVTSRLRLARTAIDAEFNKWAEGLSASGSSGTSAVTGGRVSEFKELEPASGLRGPARDRETVTRSAARKATKGE